MIENINCDRFSFHRTHENKYLSTVSAQVSGSFWTAQLLHHHLGNEKNDDVTLSHHHSFFIGNLAADVRPSLAYNLYVHRYLILVY